MCGNVWTLSGLHTSYSCRLYFICVEMYGHYQGYILIIQAIFYMCGNVWTLSGLHTYCPGYIIHVWKCMDTIRATYPLFCLYYTYVEMYGHYQGYIPIIQAILYMCGTIWTLSGLHTHYSGYIYMLNLIWPKLSTQFL